LEKVKFFKGISTVLKLENQSNHWTKSGKTVLLKAYWYTPPEVGTIEFDGRVYGNLDDEKEENFVPK
jgi:hypothetical protein